MFDFLERGPLMAAADTGGMGGGGAAVADVSGDFGGGSADTGGDTGAGAEVHDAEFVDPGTEVAVRDTSVQVKPGERAVQNGKFSGSGRAAIEAVRALNPRLAQEFTQAVLTRDWFLREFPGGKREVAQLRQLAQKSGGEQGIGKLQSIADQMAEIDRAYEASDPVFLDTITETDEGKRGFVGLMGPAFDKFEKLGGPQFGYQMAKRFKHLMDTGGLPVTFSTQTAILNRAGKALAAGSHELAASFLNEIIENHNAVVDFFNAVSQSAAKEPPAPGTAANPQLNDRERQLSERERGLQKAEWEGAVASERKRLYSANFAALTKGRTITPEQNKDIQDWYNAKMLPRLQRWQNQASRFLANGDKEGYLREQFAFFQKAVPDSLREAINAAIPGKPGPRTTAAPQKPGGPLRPPTNGGSAAVRVAKMPPTSQLDPVRTTSAMMAENKAFTKDGRIVQWA